MRRNVVRPWGILLALSLALFWMTACAKKGTESTESSETATESATPEATAAEEAAPAETAAPAAESPKAAETPAAEASSGGNLVQNAALEPDEKTGKPKGIEILPRAFFSTELKQDPEGGYDLVIHKKGTRPEDFYHVLLKVPAAAGKSYEIRFEYRTSEDFKGEVAVQADFLPRESGKPAIGGPAPDQTSEWEVVSKVVAVPEGADKIQLVFPRSRRLSTGEITVRKPSVREVETP